MYGNCEICGKRYGHGYGTCNHIKLKDAIMNILPYYEGDENHDCFYLANEDDIDILVCKLSHLFNKINQNENKIF